MKNRLFGAGVLLLGIAAVGGMVLSFLKYTDQQRRQKGLDAAQARKEMAIQTCSERAPEVIAGYMKSQGVNSVDGFNYEKLHEHYYRECLRKHGIEP